MSKKLKVLFVAYFFPPVEGGGLPGAMRILKFLRYTKTDGYVLTQTTSEDILVDPSLQTNLPSDKVIRAGVLDPFGVLLKLQFWVKTTLKKLRRSKPAASENQSSPASSSVFASEQHDHQKSKLAKCKDFLHDLNYFPDQASAWILPAWLKGRKVIKQQGIDVIFATGSPWSSLLLGYWLSKSTRKPLIVDFRDPWINNPFHHSKGKFLERKAEKWERKIIEHAAVVSLNTEPLRDEFLSRYPDVDVSKFVVLPNGYDESDVNNSYIPSANPDELIIRHAGFLYGLRDPSLLLEAIHWCNQKAKSEGLTRRWVFEQIGAINLNYDLCSRYQHMIQDGSFRVLQQVPYMKCQQLLQEADLLVNIQPGTRTQVPSKIYDYLAVGRPILNITPHDGALGKMVIQHGLGCCFNFEDKDALCSYLNERLIYLDWLTSENYEQKSRFSIASVSEQLDDALFASLKAQV
ncbi:MAG: glycosyltransferase [Alkalimonas sp.]|nr:glycosyltransferase [Alkalimonas sp.]